jgi:hypothetical protein
VKCPNCNSLILFEEIIPHDNLTDDQPYVADVKATCKCGWEQLFSHLAKMVQKYRDREMELWRDSLW